MAATGEKKPKKPVEQEHDQWWQHRYDEARKMGFDHTDSRRIADAPPMDTMSEHGIEIRKLETLIRSIHERHPEKTDAEVCALAFEIVI